MPTTLNRAYPVPERTIAPDVQLDLQKIAEALDVDVQALYTALDTPATGLAARLTTAEGKIAAAGAWAGYSPNLVGFGSGVTVVRARYALVGNLVIGRVTVRTSVNGLSGTAFVGLPTPADPGASDVGSVLGTAYMADDSGGSNASRTGAARLAANPAGGGALTHASVAIATGGNVGASAPFAWADKDLLEIEFQYERVAA